MQLKDKIKKSPKLKKWIHWMLVPTNEARPRAWVKIFINPFIHQREKGSIVRRQTRLDVLPFNQFKLGRNSVIEDFCTINNGVGDVLIGSNTLIGIGNVIIGPIHIGNNVLFAQNIVASALNHEYRDVTQPIHVQKVLTAKIVIENDCWIAANSVITAGVTIGMHSVIGAGAIVTKNIPPYSVAVGNPARVIKQFDFKKKSWVSVRQ